MNRRSTPAADLQLGLAAASGPLMRKGIFRPDGAASGCRREVGTQRPCIRPSRSHARLDTSRSAGRDGAGPFGLLVKCGANEGTRPLTTAFPPQPSHCLSLWRKTCDDEGICLMRHVDSCRFDLSLAVDSHELRRERRPGRVTALGRSAQHDLDWASGRSSLLSSTRPPSTTSTTAATSIT